MTLPKLYGKYRGKVENNIDPLMLGRIQVNVPAVPGIKMSWALPCAPYAGPQVGFYAIPPIGANVWVEFEGGDANYPIWVGGFWSPNQAPEIVEPSTMRKVFKTQEITMILDDTPGAGGFTLQVSAVPAGVPLFMKFSSQGIEINGAPAVVKLSPTEGITANFPPCTLAMSVQETSIKVPPSSLSLTANGSSVTTPPATVSLDPQGVNVTSGPSSLAVKESVSITSQSASITAASVSVTASTSIGMTAPSIALE